jgi:hypothetical protein
MGIKLKNGDSLSLSKKWLTGNDTTCKIVGEHMDTFLMEDENGHCFEVPKSIIYDNNYRIENNRVAMSSSVYWYWFGKCIEDDEEKFENMFRDNIALIFSNREVVLTKGEYYCLDPKSLKSGGAYIGGFGYCLGAMFDSWLSTGLISHYNPIDYQDELWLVSVAGSPLSGIHKATYWSDQKGEFIVLDGSVKNSSSFLEKLNEIKNNYQIPYYMIFPKHKALANLLDDIKQKKVTLYKKIGIT